MGPSREVLLDANAAVEGPWVNDFRTRVVHALGEIGPPAKKALLRIRELMQAEQVSKETATER